MHQPKDSRATTLIITLIFLTILSMMAFALLPLVIQQKKQINMEQTQSYGLHIAEAGLNYAKWRLAHEPTNYVNEPVNPEDPPKEYNDAEGGVIGYYTLNFTPPEEGSTIVTIKSTGWVKNQDNYKRSIEAKYGRPSYTQYAFLTNSNVWFGMPTNYEGLIHSNGGIRMDSTVLTKATSYKTTYTCPTVHGCSPAVEKPGIWGTGGNQNLWDFPVPPIDFTKITVDLSILKTLTESGSKGLYLGPAPQGYHLKFKANGSVDIYKITLLKHPTERGRPLTGGCITEANSFDAEEFQENYVLDSNDLIFVEDKIWIDGTVRGRVTVVAAKLPESADRKDIVLNGNIVYTAKDGTDVLGLIAQRNILFPLYNLPQNIEIDAALLASQGNISRYCYAGACGCGNYGTAEDRVKNSLSLYGSFIANTDSDFEFAWVQLSGNVYIVISGFQSVSNQYDSYLYYTPPPYFPDSSEYKFISWNEVAN